eukprot:8155032-Pyramimonas_sp.AAC.2
MANRVSEAPIRCACAAALARHDLVGLGRRSSPLQAWRLVMVNRTTLDPRSSTKSYSLVTRIAMRFRTRPNQRFPCEASLLPWASTCFFTLLFSRTEEFPFAVTGAATRLTWGASTQRSNKYVTITHSTIESPCQTQTQSVRNDHNQSASGQLVPRAARRFAFVCSVNSMLAHLCRKQ